MIKKKLLLNEIDIRETHQNLIKSMKFSKGYSLS
jgi:hypothetical protein